MERVYVACRRVQLDGRSLFDIPGESPSAPPQLALSMISAASRMMAAAAVEKVKARRRSISQTKLKTNLFRLFGEQPDYCVMERGLMKMSMERACEHQETRR